MSPDEKYKELFRKMMYIASGHSLLIKRNSANRHIVILCQEIQQVYSEAGFEKDSFWEDVEQLATIKSKQK